MGDDDMTKMKLLGAVAIAASMVTGSAMAQMAGPDYTDHGYRHHRMSYRHSHDDWNRTHTGFWPTDVAGDVAGAAIGTAGAIATAPFRTMDNSYAYDNNGWDNRGWDTRTYAQRNGFVCTPGTWFKGEDGRRHICQ